MKHYGTTLLLRDAGGIVEAHVEFFVRQET